MVMQIRNVKVRVRTYGKRYCSASCSMLGERTVKNEGIEYYCKLFSKLDCTQRPEALESIGSRILRNKWCRKAELRKDPIIPEPEHKLVKRAKLETAVETLVINYIHPKDPENPPSSRCVADDIVALCERVLVCGDEPPRSKPWQAFAVGELKKPASVKRHKK